MDFVVAAVVSFTSKSQQISGRSDSQEVLHHAFICAILLVCA